MEQTEIFMKLTDILDRLPFELAARLVSDPFFVDIPVVVAVKGNVAQEYQKQQAVITEKSGKRGVCVVVLQIVADDIYAGLPGGPMKLKPAFQVVENVELNSDANGTGKSARKIARHIVKNVKIAGLRGLVQGMKCATPAIEPVDIKALGDGVVAEQVNFECQEFSDEQILYCAPPVATPVAGQNQITLATGTAGAAIWFTTDDTFPYPGTADQFPGSTSQLYVGPLNVDPENFIIRACAYLDSNNGSAVNYVASSVERFHN
jgi:Chitobiase/beta-hexosaminidase C-terminal domain